MQGGNERHGAPHPGGLSFSLKLLKVLHLLCSKELIYTTQVLTHLAVAELVHLGHETIEEITVVAHAHKRAVKILQRLLQDILSLEVEVVGRLIKDKQVHRLKQQLHQRQTCTLTTRQHLHLL